VRSPASISRCSRTLTPRSIIARNAAKLAVTERLKRGQDVTTRSCVGTGGPR
jgi:hypothetical protein